MVEPIRITNTGTHTIYGENNLKILPGESLLVDKNGWPVVNNRGRYIGIATESNSNFDKGRRLRDIFEYQNNRRVYQDELDAMCGLIRCKINLKDWKITVRSCI